MPISATPAPIPKRLPEFIKELDIPYLIAEVNSLLLFSETFGVEIFAFNIFPNVPAKL
jgi:hypothetical protein